MSDITERLSPAPHGLLDRCARGVASREEGEKLRALVQEALARLDAAEERARVLKEALEEIVEWDTDAGYHAVEIARAALARLPAAGEGTCICPRFRDLPEGTIIADLTCPVHGVGGSSPGDVLPAAEEPPVT